jgi:hypothetical protein
MNRLVTGRGIQGLGSSSALSESIELNVGNDDQGCPKINQDRGYVIF